MPYSDRRRDDERHLIKDIRDFTRRAQYFDKNMRRIAEDDPSYTDTGECVIGGFGGVREGEKEFRKGVNFLLAPRPARSLFLRLAWPST